MAILPVERPEALDRDECDSSPPGLRPSARNDNSPAIPRLRACGPPLGMTILRRFLASAAARLRSEWQPVVSPATRYPLPATRYPLPVSRLPSPVSRLTRAGGPRTLYLAIYG